MNEEANSPLKARTVTSLCVRHAPLVEHPVELLNVSLARHGATVGHAMVRDVLLSGTVLG